MVVLVLLLLNTVSFKGCSPKVVEIDRRDTLRLTDTAYIQQPPETIMIYKPIPQYVEVVKTDTIREETILVTENKTYIDSICTKDNDSIFITNIIQGVNANLLSTEVELRKTDKVITNTIEITKHIKDKKRVKFGVQCGYGYGINYKGLEPYIGVGISIGL